MDGGNKRRKVLFPSLIKPLSASSAIPSQVNIDHQSTIEHITNKLTTSRVPQPNSNFLHPSMIPIIPFPTLSSALRDLSVPPTSAISTKLGSRTLPQMSEPEDSSFNTIHPIIEGQITQKNTQGNDSLLTIQYKDLTTQLHKEKSVNHFDHGLEDIELDLLRMDLSSSFSVFPINMLRLDTHVLDLIQI